MRIGLLALSLALPAPIWAGETAAFLKIGVGARAIGMGGAYTAIANDVNAIAWNPAGLSNIPKRELGAMHAELAADTHYDFLGYAQPTQYGIFAAAANHLSQGSLEGRDAAGKPTSGFSAADTVLSFGYAKRFASSFQLGGNVKYIQSSIANASAQTFAVDIGGMKELSLRGPGVPMVGCAVQNLGPGMKFQDETSALPLTLAAGLGYRLPAGLILALDYKHRPNSHLSEVNVGTEYAIFPAVSLRMGYGSARALATGASGIATLNGVAMGLGLKAYGYNLDYSMTPFGELGNVQRLSLSTRF